jgi:putative transposase
VSGVGSGGSRKGNPWDNAACGSFMKPLKYEEVYRNEYRDLAEARASICPFLEKIYNQKRLHSALGYLPPAEFEADLATQKNKEAATRRANICPARTWTTWLGADHSQPDVREIGFG